MKLKIIGILVSIMLMTTFLTVAMNDEHMDLSNVTQNKMAINSFEDPVPDWKVGQKWIYKIKDINLDIEENKSIHVHLEVEEFPLEVMDNTSEYDVKFNAKIKGGYSVFIEEGNDTIDVEGQLIGTAINGNIYYSKENLGITKIDYVLSGILTVQFNELPEDWNIPNLLMAIPIPATISTTLDFGSPYTLFDFPMNASKYWGLPANNFTVNGEVRSIWLVILNIINDIANAFNYPLLPEELAALLPAIDIKEALETRGIGNTFEIPEVPALFACFSMDNVTVPAGTYNSYNISVAPINLTHALGRIYYSPDLGNIVKITGELGDLLPFLTNLEMELIEYNSGE